MFCSKCGVKISQGSKKCQNCGAPLPPDEYCGGFWGLVNGNGQRKCPETERLDNCEPVMVDRVKSKDGFYERDKQKAAGYKKKVRKLLLISSVLAAMVIIETAAIVVFFAASGNKPETDPDRNSEGLMTENNDFYSMLSGMGEIREDETDSGDITANESYQEETGESTAQEETNESETHSETAGEEFSESAEDITEDITDETEKVFSNGRKDEIEIIREN